MHPSIEQIIFNMVGGEDVWVFVHGTCFGFMGLDYLNWSTTIWNFFSSFKPPKILADSKFTVSIVKYLDGILYVLRP